MNNPIINNCPNCGNNSFSGFSGGEENTPYAILYAAKKIDDNTFNPITNKVLGVITLSCNQCGYIMLFKELD